MQAERLAGDGWRRTAVRGVNVSVGYLDARLDQARSIASSSSGFGFGFGLGLSVARSTVRAFGGDLVCRARADGQSGAEFVFSFRTAQAEAP